ncbi:VapC ribonuclease [Bryobacterales bacterium F-183]|nr:VapC ribonuclease [Bryobacterales bacterium F-183]
MIVDASAIVAICKQEPDAQLYADAIEANPPARISAVSYVEAAVIVDRSRDPEDRVRFDLLIQAAELELVAVLPEHAKSAREAYRKYGKGSGHPAQLNFGDCFSYALAKLTGEPLLYKGNDFLHTDISSAI